MRTRIATIALLIAAISPAAAYGYSLVATVPPESTETTITVSVPGTYTIGVAAEDNAGNMSAMGTAIVAVPWTPGFALDTPAPIFKGGTAQIHGYLTVPAGMELPAQTLIVLELKLTSLRWISCARATTTPGTGEFTANVRPQRTTWYRVVYRGDGGALKPATSPKTQVTFYQTGVFPLTAYPLSAIGAAGALGLIRRRSR